MEHLFGGDLCHTWVLAASVYFQDPDGNSLEFIHVLPQKPDANTQMMYLSEWEKMNKKE
jgi:lactoylglutathione lyase